MKKIIIIAFCGFFVITARAQNTVAKISKPDPAKKIQIVETSCGECQFHMAGKGCHLAIRFDGKAYFADGTSIDDHGDAHAADGFCVAIKKAEVQGEVLDNRFKVSYFKLIKKELKTN
jgi:hypothetical protein